MHKNLCETTRSNVCALAWIVTSLGKCRGILWSASRLGKIGSFVFDVRANQQWRLMRTWRYHMHSSAASKVAWVEVFDELARDWSEFYVYSTPTTLDNGTIFCINALEFSESRLGFPGCQVDEYITSFRESGTHLSSHSFSSQATAPCSPRRSHHRFLPV
jgi:hypothetical protein